MDMRKDTQIGADKLRVSGHSHVRLQVLDGLAVLILDAEFEVHGDVCLQRAAGAVPDHLTAVRKLRDGRIRRRWSERRARPRRVIPRQRLSADLWKVNGSGEGPWESVLVNNIGEHLVPARRHRGQIFCKRAARDPRGMEMPHAIHSRKADKEEMHQMTMIGNDSIHLGDQFLQPRILRQVLIWGFGTNHQPVSVFQRRLSKGWFEEIDGALIIPGFHTPPLVSKIQDRHHGDCRGRHDNPRAPAIRRPGSLAWLEAALARAGPDDGYNSNGQEQQEGNQKSSQGLLHGQGTPRERRHRDRQLPFTFDSVRKDAHLQSAELHQPQAGGKELWVLSRLRSQVWSGRKVGALPGEPQGNDLNRMNVVGTAANLYFRDARDHLWHAHRDKQMVGAGVALVENVRAAHVRTQWQGRTDRSEERRV